MSTSGKTAPVQLVEPPGSLSRHDYLLVLIPVVLLTTTLAGFVMALTLEAAIAVGAVVGAMLVVDAIFIHPPTA